MWQDFVVGTIDVFLGYALIPQIVKDFKRKRSDISFQTSVIAVVGLYIMAFTVLTLGLVFSCIVTAITATLWLVILIQGISYKNNLKTKRV